MFFNDNLLTLGDTKKKKKKKKSCHLVIKHTTKIPSCSSTSISRLYFKYLWMCSHYYINTESVFSCVFFFVYHFFLFRDLNFTLNSFLRCVDQKVNIYGIHIVSIAYFITEIEITRRLARLSQYMWLAFRIFLICGQTNESIYKMYRDNESQFIKVLIR